MNLLYPKLAARRLPAMLRLALGAALAGGCYGALHDQISYAVAPEYFTRLKFRQFAWADLGWPLRLFASVVGFVAGWWGGLFAGWFLARAGLTELPPEPRRYQTRLAFATVLTAAVLAGAAGAALGAIRTAAGLAAWDEWRELGVEDLRAFVVVSHVHTATYAGAAAGTVVAVVSVRRALRANLPNSG